MRDELQASCNQTAAALAEARLAEAHDAGVATRRVRATAEDWAALTDVIQEVGRGAGRRRRRHTH